jgi:aminoglycoside phosphotransferase (APT) family kinase protein
MGHAHFDELTDSQRQAAQAALRHVLGAVPIDAATRLSGGITTAAVFRIEAGAHRYVLRVEGAPSPMRNPYQYQSMRIASEAGIAPRLYYADEDSRVAVIDYVAQQPLHLYPGGPLKRAQALGTLLRELGSTPSFPHHVDYPDIVTRLWAHVCRTGLFAAGVLDGVNQHLAEIREAYVWDRAESVSGHNDPVPNNVLFDGKRLWLIDWENGWRNDPLVDVSIVSDHLARGPELQEALLLAWCGRAPDEGLRTRLKLARALTHLFYAGVCFSASATAPRESSDVDLTALTVAAYEQTYSADSIMTQRTPARWHALGKMFIASFLSGGATPNFEPSA